MSLLEYLHEEVTYRKKEAYQILATSYSDDQIKHLCRLFNSTKNNAIEKDYGRITFLATAALVSLMSLEVKLPPSQNSFFIEDEDMAGIVLDAMNAMLCLVEAGWKPGERLAETRLKQIRNQPKTRRRKNDEYDDIRNKINEYKVTKGHAPINFNVFLKWLVSNGIYEIERSEGKSGSVFGQYWNEKRAIGTVKNWYREIMKNN